MKEINANQFRQMYETLNINLDKLGCIMLDLDGAIIKNNINPDDLIYAKNPDRFWIKGFVAGHTPHVTLLYGLLQSGKTTYRAYVDKVLEGWGTEGVKIYEIGFFESPYEDEPYYCIVAHLAKYPDLQEAHNRLELLPHINTFPDYKAHITIAYIRKDEELRDQVIENYKSMLVDKSLKVIGINYGK